MATQGKKINLNINFTSNIKTLQEANQALANIIQKNSLLSKEGNTLKSIYNTSGSLLAKMTDLQKNNGTVTISEMKKIQKEYEKITLAINNIQQAESLAYKKQSDNLQKATTEQQQLQKELQDTQKIYKEMQQNKPVTAESFHTEPGKRGYVAGQVKKKNELSDFQKSLLNSPNYEVEIDKLAHTDLRKIPNKHDEAFKKQVEEARQLAEFIEKEKEYQEQITQEYQEQLDLQMKKIQVAQVKVDEATSNVNNIQSGMNTSTTSQQELVKLQEQLGKSYETTTKQIKLFNDTGVKTAQVNDKVESTTKKLLKTSIAHKIIVSGVTKILRSSVKAVMDMDKALTDMSIATGMSREDAYSLIPALNDMGRAAGATTTEMAALTAEYMKQGRTTKDSLQLATTTAKAAKISGLSTADTVEYLTSAINGFNLSANEAVHVSDVFAKTAAATATDFKDLAIALSKVGAQANSAGMSLEFTTTLLAKGMETTQEAPESIGTALKTVVARMRELTDYGAVLEDDTSINKVERALSAVGISLRDTNGNFRDLDSVFQELGPKWDSINTMQQQAIAQAVAGTRQQSRFLAIMQDWDRTMEISAVTLDAAGASVYQFGKYTDSIQYSVTNLTTAWQGFVASFTNTDVIKDTVQAGADIITVLTDFLELGDGAVGNFVAIGSIVTAILITLHKWHQTMVLNTEQLIQQTMLSQGVSREVAIEELNSRKLLSIRQKIYLAKERELKTTQKIAKTEETQAAKQAKQELDIKKKKLASLTQENKLTTKQSDELGELVGKNKDIKQLTDFRTKQGKELQKWAKANNIEEEKAKELAIASFAVKEGELAVEAASTAFSEEDVKNEIALAAAKGITLTQEQAKTILKIKQGQLSVEEAILQGIITKEQAIQLGLQKKSLGVAIKEKAAEIGNTLIKLAGTIAKYWYIAAPIAAIVGGLIGTTVSVGNIKAKEEAVGENQEKIYENKEKSSNITKLRDEYEEILKLKDTGLADTEDLERLESIEEELKEIDDDLVGTGQTLLAAITGKLEDLDEGTQKLIEENKGNVVDLATEKSAGAKWAATGIGAAGTLLSGLSWALGPVVGIIGTALFSGITAYVQEEVADNMARDNAKEVLGKEENQLALRQSANYQATLNTTSLDAATRKQIVTDVDALYTAVDWERFAEENYDNLETALNRLEDLYVDAAIDIGKAGNSTNHALSKQIEQYKIHRQELINEFGENSDMVEDFDRQYNRFKDLVGQESVISTLEDKGVTSNQIFSLVTQLKNLGVSGEVAAEMLKKVASAEGDIATASGIFLDELISRKNDFSNEGLAYWSNLTGVSIEDLKKKIDGEDTSELVSYIENVIYGFADLASSGINASNIKIYRDKQASKAENILKINEEIADGKLSTEMRDYISEYYGDLYADPEFQKALSEGNLAAIEMINAAFESEYKDTIDNIRTAMDDAQSMLNEDLRAYGFNSYEDFVEAKNNGELEDQLGSEWKSISDRITQRAIDIQTYRDTISDMEESAFNVEKLDEYSESIKALDAKIEELQESLDDIGTGNLNTIKQLSTLYMEKAALTNLKLQEALEKTAKTMNITTDQLKDYYTIVNGKLIPNTVKINALQDEFRQAWLNGAESIEEATEALAEYEDIIEDLNQQAVDDAIANQEFYLEHMKSAYEKEAEALKESLDERKEMYDKYFDALEGEEETQDYEKERQTLINRIAKLSTATDSESLKQLKEAQQELGELNKEYNSSQREQRREAVSTRLDEASENIDKKLEEILADGNELWREWINQAKNLDEESAKAWLSSLGQFDGMTDLMIDNFMKGEWLDNKATFDSYVNSGYTFDGITNAILEGIKQAPVTTTTENGDAINNQVSATIESIVIGENTNYSTEEIKELVQKAFEDSWSAIATQWGINLNRKE